MLSPLGSRAVIVRVRSESLDAVPKADMFIAAQRAKAQAAYDETWPDVSDEQPLHL